MAAAMNGGIGMTLEALLQGVDVADFIGQRCVTVSGLTSDHRLVKPGFAFVCYRGVKVDSHTFIHDAVKNGAVAVIGEQPVSALGQPSATYIQVRNGREALSLLAANWHGRPADRLNLIGVTGTNGKTSTTYLGSAILNATGLKCAILGTIGHQVGEMAIPAVTTTPDALALHALFRNIADAGINHVLMETSSQGLAQHRLAGLTFETGVFTNLTQDHLDYHQTMEAYLRAKIMLFEQLASPNGLAILNADDPATQTIRQHTRTACLTYGIRNPADLTARDIETTLRGMAFTARAPNGEFQVKLRLPGDYNVYNALAAIGIGLHHGCSLEAIQAGLESTIVPGRFQLIDRGQDFAVVVDYAHTPDGLENLLKAAKKMTQAHLISVFGCGGDRDRGKRPKMGHISATIADHSIITSDNPRTEDPSRIIADIVEGLPADASYDVIPNRRDAIKHAIGLATSGDVVVIAGKGHEPYQEVNGVRHHFDDREVASEVLCQNGE